MKKCCVLVTGCVDLVDTTIHVIMCIPYVCPSVAVDNFVSLSVYGSPESVLLLQVGSYPFIDNSTKAKQI